MFTVRLATTRGFGRAGQTPQALGRVKLDIEEVQSILDAGPGSRIRSGLVLPAPGDVFNDAIPTTQGVAVLRFILECGVDVVKWQVEAVGPHDIFTLTGGQAPALGGATGTPDSLYVGAIHHVQQQAGNPCQVACAHGNVIVPKTCCIECKVGRTTVKFCC